MLHLRSFVFTYIRNANDDNISKVIVFELDFPTKTWAKIKSLNGHAFFISHGDCTWCSGSSGTNFEGSGNQENCVYQISDNKRIIFCYNIVERSMTRLSLFPNLTTPISSYAWVNATLLSLPIQRYVGLIYYLLNSA